MINLDTWLISDTHFGHDNIVKYEPDHRPVDHDWRIYNNWIKMVGINDPILHLGDLCVWFGRKRKVWLNACYGLPGDKMLVLGNHDEQDGDIYRKLGFWVRKPFIQEVDGIRIFFSHEPAIKKLDTFDINIHGHLHANGHREGEGGGESWHRNISVELTDLKPIRLKEVI